MEQFADVPDGAGLLLAFPVSLMEADLIGRGITSFRFVRWSTTGYAVCSDQWGARWHLHPEALEVLA